MRDNNKEFFKELVEYVLKPVRLLRMSCSFGLDMAEYVELI
jgi:hypothetical protein